MYDNDPDWDERRGTHLGLALYLLADGTLAETSRDGHWNDHEDFWSADVRPVDVAHAIRTYDLRDIVHGLHEALWEQISGNEGKATKAAEAMAERLQSIIRLITT